LDGISELDLYSEKYLLEICGDIYNLNDNVYFFTRPKKLSKNRVGQTTGCGVWNESSTNKIYDYKGDIIGARKFFLFQCKTRLVHHEIQQDYALVHTCWEARTDFLGLVHPLKEGIRIKS
jgi:hypothetical protein